MRVELADGDAVGHRHDVYELPQGLGARRAARAGAGVVVPYRAEVVRDVDVAARPIVIDPPAGLLD